MGRNNFERAEFIVGIIFSMIGLADVVLILATRHGGTVETCHQAIQSFLLTALVMYSSIMLVRWYRHHDEVLEALNISTKLLQHDEIVTYLRDIVGDCSKIRKKRWPEFAELFLVTLLQHLRGEIGKLKAGQATVALDVGQSLSPKFFTITRGLSFVTAYKHWDYWTTQGGHDQLQANMQAIRDGYGPIVRVMILPNQNETATTFPSDEVIQKQIAAKIDLRVIREESVEIREFRRDVGVFFHGDRDEVVFMSEWDYSEPEGVATLTFEGESLTAVGKRMHDYLITRATRIKDLNTWTNYKKNGST